MRTVTLLGATGSIGKSAQAVIEADPGRFRVHAVTAHHDVEGLAAAARRLDAARAVIGDASLYAALKAALAGSDVEVAAGEAALIEAAALPVDVVISAIVGAAGLRPTAAAVAAGNTVALANKECLVCAGAAFMALARANGVRVLPIDSEHNALFQLLEDRDRGAIESFVLTASGGPFRTASAATIEGATLEQALAHPTWAMGAKITIDSATLMNKGLELIEASHLFDLPPERLDVLVHPQSVVHALIRFRDGSVHAECGAADMRRPIAHCLYWPERRGRADRHLDLAAVGPLTFERPDGARFPALPLARAALQRGDGAPTVLNAANEVAVGRFLDRRIGFTMIPATVERTLERAEQRNLLREPGDVEEALALDAEARSLAAEAEAALRRTV